MHFSTAIATILWSASSLANPLLLKSAPEVFASYAAITNVSASDPDLIDLYRVDKRRLPQTGATSEMSSNVVLALTELGGQFCAKSIANEMRQGPSLRHLFTDIDFTQGPKQFADDYIAGLVVDRLANAFWNRPSTNDEKQSILKTIRSSSSGNLPKDTRNVTQIACTLFASSINFLVK